MLKVKRLLCEGMLNPLGVDFLKPRLTWTLECAQRNTVQTAFHLIVSKSSEEISNGIGSYFDSGKLSQQDQSFIIGDPIEVSSTRFYWAVKVWDNHDQMSAWSEPAWFETGLLHLSDWNAKWIEPEQLPVPVETGKMGQLMANLPQELGVTPEEMVELGEPMVLMARVKPKPVDESVMHPCPMIRKEFSVKSGVRSARAYATAHGLYRLEINGKRVGDLEFMPEATPYTQFLQYQTYDVTNLLREGENGVGIILADGWWAGRIGLTGNSCTFGDKLALLLQINIEYEDGGVDRIGTDETFTSSDGPLRFSDLYMGEKYDARLERIGWSSANFVPQSEWRNVVECAYDMSALVGQNANPIRTLKTLKPVEIYTSPKGETIVDFGQCLAGNARFVFEGQVGQQIVLSYTQQTDKDGNYDINILMPFNNQHQDYYICKGEKEETYEPIFTYRGFRYVRVEGYEGPLDKEKIEARLIASDVELIGEFKCSHPLVNKLQQNIQWTLISNLMSIPTDNPDRERAGWTGDHQMIATTMYYNLQMQAFIRRWMAENRLEQRSDGSISAFVPSWYNPSDMEINTPSGWGDNSIITPWVHYQEYGDIRILEENYSMMKGWMSYVMARAAQNPPDSGEMTPERLENYRYIWNGDFQHGDWMTPSENFDSKGNWKYMGASIEEFTTCYYMAYSSDLMAKIALLLNKKEDASYFEELGRKIRKAVIAEYFDTGYIMNSKFQGVPVLSLKMHLIPEDRRKDVADRLEQIIQSDGGKANVGFTSNEHILNVLCEEDKVGLAYDLLLQEDMPSWLYMARKGTTIWEAWQVVMPDGTVNIASLIQYALGNIGKWMYTAIGGIEAAEPGYRRIKIAPILDPKLRITSGEGSLISPYGKIESSWNIDQMHFSFNVEIPCGTSAEIVLPFAGISQQIFLDGEILEKQAWTLTNDHQDAKIVVGSGKYLFYYNLTKC